MTTTSPRHSDEAGFTLVETMVALAIFVAVMTLIFAQLTSGIQHTSNIDRATIANSTARLVLSDIVNELRQAGTGDVDLAAISDMTATSVTFYTPDRKSPMHMRKVTYKLVSGVLQRREEISTNTGAAPWVFAPVITPTYTPILKGVVNTDVFTYLTSTGTAAATGADVSLVQIHLVLKSGMTAPATVTFDSDVKLRSKQ